MSIAGADVIRSIIRENAIRNHRLQIFVRLPGAPIPRPLEDLDPVTRDCWELLYDFERKWAEAKP